MQLESISVFGIFYLFFCFFAVANIASVIYVVVDAFRNPGTVYHKLLWTILALSFQVIAFFLYIYLKNETRQMGQNW